MREIPNKHKQVASCELCKGDHPTDCYPPFGEEVNYMGNPNLNQSYQPRHAPYQNKQGYQQKGNNQGYQQGWRQEAEPSNRQNPHHNYNQPPQPQGGNSKIEDTLTQFMKMSMANQKSTDAAIKNLEMQVGQLSKQLADQHKGTFFANTQDNPKEHCKYILTRSGRKIDMGIGDKVEEEESVVEKEKEKYEIEVEKIVRG